MKNSFPARIAVAMMAMMSSAASLWRDPAKKHQGERSYSSEVGGYRGGNKHAKSSFKQNKRRGL